VDDADACGDALSCLCGVCTVACQIEESCASLPGAACMPRSDGTCGAVGNVCDVGCETDADCAPLSSAHSCTGGVCRATPEPVDGGAAGSSSVDPPAGACIDQDTSPNQVLVIGDSFFATSHQITAYLEDLARSESLLAPGERYRDNSRLTANALALSTRGILGQYESAAAEAEVSIVIMNGGGADVLLGSCDTPDATCPVISAAALALDEVLAAMAEDGVTGVVFAGYPDPQPAGVREKMDALRPLLEASCQNSPVPCTWVDLREPFLGNYDTFVIADGMNPTDAGSQAAATALWTAMQANCAGQ